MILDINSNLLLLQTILTCTLFKFHCFLLISYLFFYSEVVEKLTPAKKKWVYVQFITFFACDWYYFCSVVAQHSVTLLAQRLTRTFLLFQFCMSCPFGWSFTIFISFHCSSLVLAAMKSAADSASGNSPAFGSQEFNDKGYVNAMWVTTCHVTMLDCSAKADKQEATHPEYACHFLYRQLISF